MIAEQIKKTLDTISDWTDEYTATYGIVFKKVSPTNLDAVAERYASEGNWHRVLAVKRKAEIVGYSSSTIDDKVKQALTNISQFTSQLPKMPDGWWWNSYYHLLNCFKYARELNHETDKWSNPLTAFRTLRNLRFEIPPFHRCNPDTGVVERLEGGRWLDSAALAGAWMKFAEVAKGTSQQSTLCAEVSDILPYEWRQFNRLFWLLSTKGNYYKYGVENEGYDASFGSIALTWAKAFTLHSLTLTENFHYLIMDISNRCISKKWDSPQWGGYSVAVKLYPTNPERRLDGTLIGWAAIQTFYRDFSDSIKQNVKNMLLGKDVPKASENLLASDLFDSASNRFRMGSGESLSDRASCFGAATLFLNAIVPDTGSLAIPLRAEGIAEYEAEFFDPTHFEFNYEAKRIKIPVYAGKLKFIFGDKEAEVKFPYDGIYAVTFSTDWNSITSIQRVGDLKDIYAYPPKAPSALELSVAAIATMIGTAPIYYFSKDLIKKAEEVAK